MNSGTLVIAHRGASGYLPEHTREAKALAYGQGADFLEQDVVATRDGALVVLHDIVLDHVTDVAAKFPGRCREDGQHYVIDFDLHELTGLDVLERRRPGSTALAYPQRFRASGIAFRIVTLDEEIGLIKELNRTTGRQVGIYPEIKRPDWHRRHGFDLAAALLDTLEGHGYRSAEDLAFVQCFDGGELRRCREELGTRLKLVQLIDCHGAADPFAPAALADIGAYADVAAPHYSQLIVPTERKSGATALRVSPAVRAAADCGLTLHAYTFRRDDLPPYVAGLEPLLEFFLTEVEVGGVFCDHPDVAVRVRERLRSRSG